MTRKRILHFIESGGLYGAESVIINLSREMATQDSYEPVVGCIVQNNHQDVDLVEVASSLNIESHRLCIANSRAILELPRAAAKLKRLGIGLIHSHGYKPSVYAFIIGRLTGIPVLATCHLWFMDSDAPMKMRFMVRLERYLYRFFPAVVAVSKDIRSILLANRVDPTRVHLIKNGIALEDYRDIKGGRRQERGESPRRRNVDGVRDGDVCVLTVGRLTEQKAQRDLVSAAALIKKAGKQVKILIVGEGELRESLEQQIEQLGVGDQVSLLGFRDDIGSLLRRADIFVLPSKDEGMPISLLEAVAAGVPVITTMVGDIPKLIKHGVTGIAVEINDPPGLAEAILSLSDDVDSASVLAERAFEALRESYSSAQMYREYDRVYQAVLCGGR